MSLDVETDCVIHKKELVLAPKYPSFMSCKDRIKSYKEWPEQIRQKPKDLSKSGFFYQGYGDRVTCFACGVTLKNWSVNDNPEFEHKKWSLNCPYLDLILC